MKKRFTLITAALMMLTILAVPIGMRGQTRDNVTLQYTGSTTFTWEEETNYASELNLSATNWSVTGQKNDASNMTACNKDGSIRLYPKSGNGSSITVTNLNSDNINTISFSMQLNEPTVKVGGNIVEPDEGVYTINSTSFVVINGIDATSGSQVQIKSISINYTPSSTPTVATPTFSPAAGVVASGTEVAISCATDGATIYYTTNGDTPTASSTEYTDVIEVTSAMTIKAVGVKDGYNNSEVAEAAYTVFTPIYGYAIDFESDLNSYVDWEMSNMGNSNNSISAHGGSKYGANINAGGSGVGTASITTKAKIANPGNLTCYVSKTTTNTTASTWYIEVSSNGTDWTEVENRDAKDMTKGTWVEFSADLSSYSDVYVRVRYDGSTAIRAIDDLSIQMASSVATPAFSVAGGTYSDNQSVTISCETDGAAIYYTTDGTDPTSGSTPYSSAISITQTTTLKAIAIKDQASSNVATATYVLKVATPTFSPEAGTYDAAKNVTISCATDGAAIYYTLDGTTPTSESTPYAGAITVSENKTIKAIAVKATWENSNVATATYTIVTVTPAVLPFTYTDGKAGITIANGFTSNGLGNDYSGTTKLRFDDTGDWVLLKLNAAPKAINYDIKGNSFSGGTFTVQVSSNGEDYTDIATHTDLGDTQTITLINSDDAVRYIKWVYTNKSSGNVGLGNLNIKATAEPTDIDGNLCVFNDLTLTSLTINADKVCTIYAGSTLTVTGTLTNNGTAANLIIEDGGQLVHTSDVSATMKKNITGYGGAKGGSHWYTIASPVDNEPVSTLTTGTYDLYAYTESTHTWYNQKAHTGDFTTLSRGTGYLYANSAAKVIDFAGSMKATNAEVTVPLSYTDALPVLKGVNLVGNPFTRNLTAGEVKIDGTALTTYLAVEVGSELVVRNISTTPIKPGQGFFVQLPESPTTTNLVFNPSSKGETDTKPAFVCIEAGDANFMDRAYVQIGQGNKLNKVSINEEVSHLYVTNKGKDFAAVTIENAQGEMPVNFKAAYDGNYSISVSTVGLDLNYLHLIDKLTGNDIDLLATPEYTFSAKRGDGENRFRLVFEANGNALVTSNEPFAYFNGSEWVIENDGNATLQVIDVMGRMLRSENVSGNATTSLPNLSAGVYVLRLVNSESIRTQKVVIE